MRVLSLYECSYCSSVLSSDFKNALAKVGGRCPFCRDKGKFGSGIEIRPKRIFDNISNAREIRIVEAVFIDCNGFTNPRAGIRLHDDYFRDVKILEGFTKVRTPSNNPLRVPVELVHFFDVSITKDHFTFCTAIDDVMRDLDKWTKAMFP